MTDHMLKRLLFALIALVLCIATYVAAVGQTAPAANGPAHPQSAVTDNPGEKIFTANCARCHTPPMTLNPRVAGTVILHMRVRARLTRKDEKLLLQYLAP